MEVVEDSEEKDIMVDLNELPQLKPELERLQKRKAAKQLVKNIQLNPPAILSCGEKIDPNFHFDALFQLIRAKGWTGSWYEFQSKRKHYQNWKLGTYDCVPKDLVLFKTIDALPKGTEVKLYGKKGDLKKDGQFINNPIEFLETVVSSIRSVIDITFYTTPLMEKLVKEIVEEKVINKLTKLASLLNDKICLEALNEVEFNNK